MEKMTKGQMEAEVSKALIKFQREYMGRGPREAKAYIVYDMILVRLKGALIPAEQQLARNPTGTALIKEMRAQLVESSRSILEDMVHQITSCKMVSLHTDISTRTGEGVFVFTLDRNLEDLFR